MPKSVVIVGANLAGACAAEELRDMGYEGEIHLVGEENALPYERPPLSKDFLYDGLTAEDISLRDNAFYSEKKINLVLGSRVTSIHPDEGKVCLQNDTEIAADNIVLCTGAKLNRLASEFDGIDGIYYLRDLEDSIRLRDALTKGGDVVVVGMGVIGAEVAASASKMGCKVTAIEYSSAPMLRCLGDDLGAWSKAMHEAEGVRVLTNTGLADVKHENGHVTAIETTTGEKIPATIVIVGIGVTPNVELAAAAGIELDNGIVVDMDARTSVSTVYAAGDVTMQPGYYGGKVRLETYDNAREQARCVAASIAGEEQVKRRAPWYWTDQFDVNIQIVGSVNDASDLIYRNRDGERSFTAIALEDSLIVGAVTVNRPQDMGVLRRIADRRIEVDAAKIADDQIQLRTFLSA
ncbi:MAG: FAD-dependent oxidoreductase [Kordiimonadaceae bacterium]|nr:FAD-dependent oxidoreductase [Kordiimonadaceae bacterium]